MITPRKCIIVFFFSSEMKVIEDMCIELHAFPPGHFFTPKLGFMRYYEVLSFSIVHTK